MIKVKIDETITLELVEKLVLQYQTRDICIVIDNTKKQSINHLEEIAKKYSYITISVIGGLNPKKDKFNNEYYQRRTYYTPMELCKIIEYFSSIERKINISWTETQKVMFVYQELCNSMEYEELQIGKKDVCRNLIGVMYGKAVCSGFAMIFKEALDRLGIENEYQNQQSSHSWNIAKVDGKYRAFELTWDCYNKGENGCSFMFFNLDENFYKHKYHDISDENEEIEYQIVPYTQEELRNDYKKISNKLESLHLTDKCEIPLSIVGKKYMFKKSGEDIKILGDDYKFIERRNGSRIYLINVGTYGDLNKFLCLEVSSKEELKISRIYSESQLDKLDEEYDSIIANGLLSSERLSKKVKQFNGYVGYVGRNHTIYYNGDFEKETLNIFR